MKLTQCLYCHKMKIKLQSINVMVITDIIFLFITPQIHITLNKFGMGFYSILVVHTSLFSVPCNQWTPWFGVE